MLEYMLVAEHLSNIWNTLGLIPIAENLKTNTFQLISLSCMGEFKPCKIKE